MSQLHEYNYRILVIGDSNVGKTHILSNYISNKNILNQIFTPTIGVDFYTKLISTGSKKIKLHIWDTSGDKNFKNIVQAYYTSVAAAIIVYDITHRESFEHIKIWLDKFRERNHKLCELPILVIGNCPTHKRKRQVEKYELENFGELHNTMIAEVESCEMTHLHNIFQPLWNKITNKFVIAEKYNPGIKRLSRELFLPKITPSHAQTQEEKKQIHKQNEMSCVIS